MRDLKEILEEVDLEEVVGGLANNEGGNVNLIDSLQLAPTQYIANFAQILAKEGYDLQTLKSSLSSLPLEKKVALLRFIKPGSEQGPNAQMSEADLNDLILQSIQKYL